MKVGCKGVFVCKKILLLCELPVCFVVFLVLVGLSRWRRAETSPSAGMTNFGRLTTEWSNKMEHLSLLREERNRPNLLMRRWECCVSNSCGHVAPFLCVEKYCLIFVSVFFDIILTAWLCGRAH